MATVTGELRAMDAAVNPASRERMQLPASNARRPVTE
jgi:hypothetical protein